MSDSQEHFQAFLTYAFIPLLLIGMIGIIIIAFMLGWDMLKDRFPRFPKHTGKVITDIKHVYITPIHNDKVETLQAQGWEIVDKHPTHPGYVIMTKPAED